jgi:electron transport complex protein RnfB
MQDIYLRLAAHLEKLVMGYPFNEALPDLLREMFSPVEAEVALAIPNNLAPLEVVSRQTIVDGCHLPESTTTNALKSLAGRNILYSRTSDVGDTGYALLQVGYGVPQTFFWGGQNDERARRMAKLVLNYFNVPTTQKVYGPVPTKTYKYAPANLSIDIAMQGVMPNEQMAPIVDAAVKIAVAHCPCRMSAKILGRTDCRHSLEVCIKYDELADFVISKGLAREISKDEAHQILAACEKEGLVHMVDNAQGQIKHTCNCCGHYCWNVGILRRRKIPRDMLILSVKPNSMIASAAVPVPISVRWMRCEWLMTVPRSIRIGALAVVFAPLPARPMLFLSGVAWRPKPRNPLLIYTGI